MEHASEEVEAEKKESPTLVDPLLSPDNQKENETPREPTPELTDFKLREKEVPYLAKYAVTGPVPGPPVFKIYRVKIKKLSEEPAVTSSERYGLRGATSKAVHNNQDNNRRVWGGDNAPTNISSVVDRPPSPPPLSAYRQRIRRKQHKMDMPDTSGEHAPSTATPETPVPLTPLGNDAHHDDVEKQSTSGNSHNNHVSACLYILIFKLDLDRRYYTATTFS